MATDYFLKIDGIQGESKDQKHHDEIEIGSFSFGATQSGSFSAMGGGGAGKVSMQDFHFTIPTQNASPKLLLACARGDHIKSAVLTCRKAGKEQREFLKYTFTDLLVSSFQTGGSSDTPMDQISMNFTTILAEYAEQKPTGELKGTIKAGYDLKQMKELQ
ncbi:MAG TPA: type VI secretion system tube protein Hcp [Chthoniobacterales bacterium]|jgi:type VI secretion system secreted protein Hcp|nr:type VI secretion system tube protein Hcp [Chthoniobacterales bacterium]